MPASNNPTATAKDYATGLYDGQIPKSQKPLGDGGFIAELSDGSFVTFRPAGQASDKTEPTTATVDINDTKIKQLNGGRVLKLKFPKK
jgi:filamentous hemagglutinin